MITAQPKDLVVTEGETATFIVEATGDSLTYQWFKDRIALTDIKGSLEGVNTQILNVVNAMPSDEGDYLCFVTNGAGDVDISDDASLEISTGKQHLHVRISIYACEMHK